MPVVSQPLLLLLVWNIYVIQWAETLKKGGSAGQQTEH